MNLFGNEPMPPQQVAPYRQAQADAGQDSAALLAEMRAAEAKRQARNEKAVALIGALALAKGMGGKGGDGAPTSSRGGAAPLEGGTRGGGGASAKAAPLEGGTRGRSRRDSGAAASKPYSVASEQAKIFPVAGVEAMASAAGAAGAGGGFLSSPVGGAATAAGIDLVGGLLGGGSGDQEEIAKDQLRASRQINLFDGFRQMNDRLERRNQEMRAALAGLGQ